MNQYFVEGLFIPQKASRKVHKPVEPYTRVVWAGSPSEAIEIATQELAGGQWVEGPTVGNTTEEQRMRQAGAPELPGLGAKKASKDTAKAHLKKATKITRKETRK